MHYGTGANNSHGEAAIGGPLALVPGVTRSSELELELELEYLIADQLLVLGF